MVRISDITRTWRDFREGPIAVVSKCSNVKPKLFDHLVGAGEQGRRHINSECLRGL
jgi:hypothetical protein